MARTVIIDIRDSAFPAVSIPKDTFVVWRNLDPFPHSAETQRESSFYFNAGALLPGEVSAPIYFDRPGKYDYLCRFHAGMTGVVAVTDDKDSNLQTRPGTSHDMDHEGHGGHGLKHFHGFVTGGRTGQRLYMTHTPVIADPRHRFQIILQGRLGTKLHSDAYEKVRNSAYGDGKVQIFHDHLSLKDIADGTVTLLPESSFQYYPDDPAGLNGKDFPGLEEKIPVNIDKVIHFHEFEPDSDYPNGLAYLMYGDANDVFIDHYITRAPNFHSVAKLARVPSFWTGNPALGTIKVVVPSKQIRDVSPKLIRRIAFVDNSFHMFWLPPPGIYATPPQDPLIRRDNGAPVYDVLLNDGTKGQIEIGRFLHFDVRLLNYGVLIV